MKKKELTVEIPIGDCEAEYLAAEPEITGPDSLIELRKVHSIGSVARMAVAARARGEAPVDIIKADKLLYLSGAQADIAEMISSRVVAVQLENGSEINVRSWVAEPPGERDDEGGVIVGSVSTDGLDRALRYLHNNVPGYVRGRLEIVAANRGDVREAAQVLVDAVWEIVTQLGEPQTE